MKTTLFAAVATVLLVTSSAVPTPSNHVLHEKRTSLPRSWVRSDRVEREAILPVRVGLVQNNLHIGEDLLMEVSNPSSTKYGKHWTQEEVHDMFAPSTDVVQQVREWLVSSGVSDDVIVHSENKGWLAFDIPAWKAEELFQTEYHEHFHSTSGSVKVGSDHYYIPDHIREHIDYVTPGVKLSAPLKKSTVKRELYERHSRPKPGPFMKPAPKWPGFAWPKPPGAGSLPASIQGCDRNITPACLKALYKIPDAHLADPKNVMGLYESGDTYSQEDLNLFFAKYAPNVPQGTHPTLDSIDGGAAPVAPGSDFNTGESDIDMDIAYSLIYPQKVTLYQVNDIVESQTDGNFNNFLDALDGSYCTYTAYNITGNSPGLDATYPDPAPGGYKGPLQCGAFKPTRVISVSYGVSEYDAPVAYTKRQCNELLKLGLQGTTFLWASGDYGVASYPGDDNDNGCLGKDSNVYNPSFPTCPWVTNVGATRLYEGQTVLNPESALQANLGGSASLFATAGGFANYFPVPLYQKLAVGAYLAFHNPGLPSYVANADATNIGEGGGFYNRAGRGFPDVSANGALFRAFNDLRDTHFYGTSLAAPIWGSIVTLINEERTAMGKGPVGFINPVLYASPWAFNDIKNGSNPGCGSTGFKAVDGWDPVTGLGTPQYPSLLKLFLALP